MVDYVRARRHLIRRDPRLGAVIKQVGPCGLGEATPQTPFMALAYAIASQQLSAKAADTIFGRFCDLFPPDRVPDPVRLAAIDADAIRAAGFSRPKAGFLKDLAAQVVDRRLPLETLHDLEDADVMRVLTGVKGIGRWTAEVFLMFRLGRPDIFPADESGPRQSDATDLPISHSPVAGAAARARRNVAALPFGGRLVFMAEPGGRANQEQRTQNEDRNTTNEEERRRNKESSQEHEEYDAEQGTHTFLVHRS